MTQVGDLLADRYEVDRSIARGGMADVFLARDQQLDRRVAIKVLFPEFARDPSFVERFRREAQNAAMLNHANIVSVYDYGQERGTYFIVMEYVEGESLRDILRSQGALAADAGGAHRIRDRRGTRLRAPPRRRAPRHQARERAPHAPGTGEGHRLRHRREPHGRDARASPQTGAVIGTATYFSPEQAQGYQVDGRTDVYALGIVLYEMMTGRPPFTAESPVAVAMKHVREEPVPLSHLAPDVPPDLERIVMTALAKDLRVRYQTADDLRADLMRFGRGRPLQGAMAAPVAAAALAGDPTIAAAAPEVHPDQIWSDEGERRWGPIIATIIGLALLVGVIVYALAFLGQNEGGTDNPTAEVPNLIGQPYDAAAAQLEEIGFKVTRQDELHDAPVDQVVEQRPEAGLLLEKGRTVVLTVSARQVQLPNVVGQPFDQASAALTKIGLDGEPHRPGERRPGAEHGAGDEPDRGREGGQGHRGGAHRRHGAAGGGARRARPGPGAGADHPAERGLPGVGGADARQHAGRGQGDQHRSRTAGRRCPRARRSRCRCRPGRRRP